MRKAIQKKTQKRTEEPEESINPAAPTQSAQSKSSEINCLSVSTLSKGFADENRLRILLCLIGKRKSVTRIVEEVGLSQPLVSHHLKELKRCLLVTIERSGPFIYYSLSDPRALDIVRLLDSLAADLLAARKTL